MFKILEKLTAKNKKQDDIRMPSHLSAAEQKQVQTVINRARGDRTVPHSAQESIPFQRMFPDGICRVTDNYYTKTIQQFCPDTQAFEVVHQVDLDVNEPRLCLFHGFRLNAKRQILRLG